jgi:hypothetical protein
MKREKFVRLGKRRLCRARPTTSASASAVKVRILVFFRTRSQFRLTIFGTKWLIPVTNRILIVINSDLR